MISQSVNCIQDDTDDTDDTDRFNFPNYGACNQALYEHGGLIIYVHDDLAFKELNATLSIAHTFNLSSKYEEKIVNFKKVPSARCIP